MQKVLSIVIPTYNMELFLDKCLSSLLLDDENLSKIDVLVINDGSKDRSLDVAKKYSKRYPDSFRVIDKENGNYGSCINKGIELSTGKYFRILDADDWVNTSSLEILIQYLENCETDMVVTKYSVVYPDVEITSTFNNGIIPQKEYSPNELNEDIVSRQMIQMHGITYKTSILRSIGLHLQHGISYTDTEFCYYPCKSVQSIVFLDIQLYCYNNTREGQTMDPKVRARSLTHMFKVLSPMLEDYCKTPEKDRSILQTTTVENILVVFYQTAVCSCMKSSDVKSMLEYIDNLMAHESMLNDFVCSLKLHRLHYVKIWRKYGLLNTAYPFRLYNAIWDKTKALVKS